MTLNTKITLFFYRYPFMMYIIMAIGLIILQIIFRMNIVYAMDHERDNIKQIFDNLANGNENEARLGLESLYRNANDEQRIRLRVLLVETNNRYNFANYMVNTDTFTLMNAGQIPQEEPSIRNPLISIVLAAGILTLGYIILRNWSTIRDILFDLSQTVANDVITYGLRRTFASLSMNRNALLYFLNESQQILHPPLAAHPA